MPAVRRHLITGDPILYAPERASRPRAFGEDTAEGRCPFCRGNEGDTPPEIARRGDPWRVRVFPNKFPAVDGHEIIVESAEHDANFDELSNIDEILSVYLERYSAHSSAPYVALFKNHGTKSGASLQHPHSQLMPLPFVPPMIARQFDAFERAVACPLCVRPDNVISESDSFVRFAPHAPAHAWEQWIAPKAHYSDLLISPDLGPLLQEAVRDARSISPAYNVIWYPFRGAPRAHFYLVVIPRMTPMAGFEVGTGTFIDIIDPAATARRFR